MSFVEFDAGNPHEDKQLFGTGPDVLDTDKGFYENMKQIIKLEENIVTVSIYKKAVAVNRNMIESALKNSKMVQDFPAGAAAAETVVFLTYFLLSRVPWARRFKI